MARYKYSENTKEVTDIYFDTETHGEYMGMEQSGEMKHIKGPMVKSGQATFWIMIPVFSPDNYGEMEIH